MRRNGATDGRRPRNALVTVIVCNHNHGRFLTEAVESVATQTHDRIELLLVDDGSTDGSPAVMEHLLRRFRTRFDPMETVLRSENNGQLACLNASLDRIRGDLTVVLDADDVLRPTYLEESIAALHRHRRSDPSVAGVYSDCELMDRQGRVLVTGTSVPWDRDLLARSSYIPGCAVTLSAPLRAAAPFDESIRVGTKHHRWLRLSGAGWTARHLPRPLFSYRLHDGNNSGIGERLLPKLNGHRDSEQALARVWPTAG